MIGLVACTVVTQSIRSELRFRRIRRAPTEVAQALIIDAELACELSMVRREAMGVKLQKHSLAIAEEASHL